MKKSVSLLVIALVILMPISLAYEEKTYIYGIDLIASKEGNNIQYYNQDYLSSNRIISSNNGNIIGKNTQEPYGSNYEEKGTKEALNNDYKFTGKEEDIDNLYYFGARYYESSNGRFISVDPVFDSSKSPYAYANNNPLKYVDSTGKQTDVPSLHSPNYFGSYFYYNQINDYSNFQGSTLEHHNFELPGVPFSSERLLYSIGYNLDPETSWPMNFLISFGLLSTGTSIESIGKSISLQGSLIRARVPITNRGRVVPFDSNLKMEDLAKENIEDLETLKLLSYVIDFKTYELHWLGARREHQPLAAKLAGVDINAFRTPGTNERFAGGMAYVNAENELMGVIYGSAIEMRGFGPGFVPYKDVALQKIAKFFEEGEIKLHETYKGVQVYE